MINTFPPKLIVSFTVAVLTMLGCAVVNTAVPTYNTPSVEVSYNPLGGKMSISKWFSLQVHPSEFDVDKDGTLTMVEAYTHTKATRTIFDNSPIIKEADIDKSGYVTDTEWARIVAQKRVSGEWVQVFDTNQDGKMTVEEELQGLNHINRIKEYYTSIVQQTALFWRNTFDPDVAATFDVNGDSQITDEEIGTYLNAYMENFMFSYDWNGDGEVKGAEQATASQVVLELFKELNQYLLAKKAQEMSEYL